MKESESVLLGGPGSSGSLGALPGSAAALAGFLAPALRRRLPLAGRFRVLLGFEVSDHFVQFNQMDDMFARAFWDESIRNKDTDGFFASYRMEAAPRRGEGFRDPCGRAGSLFN